MLKDCFGTYENGNILCDLCPEEIECKKVTNLRKPVDPLYEEYSKPETIWDPRD